MHLPARDTSFVAISRAPFAKLDAFKKRMGWKFRWVPLDLTPLGRNEEELKYGMEWVRLHDKY